MNLSNQNRRIIDAIIDEAGFIFDADQETLALITKRMGWRSPKQAAKALENLRRAGAIQADGRKPWYEPKRWVVVAKLEAVA